MKRAFILIAMALCLCTASSCENNHSEKVLESLQAVETAMRLNVDDPDALLGALDDCIERYRPVWEESSRLLEKRSKDSVEREMNLQIAQLRAVSQNIIDLDLEIQDRLKNHPDLLKAYGERIQRIGAR